METKQIKVPGCKGTTVQNLYSIPGMQVMKVDVSPGGEIPIHKHSCAATMVIMKGEAKVLGKGKDRVVRKGEVVAKDENEPHGFTEVKEPFSFISISYNDGIMQDQNNWDMEYLTH